MARHKCQRGPHKQRGNRYNPNNPKWSDVHSLLPSLSLGAVLDPIVGLSAAVLAAARARAKKNG